MRCLLLGTLITMFACTCTAIHAHELEDEESNPADKKYMSMTKDQYESEVIKLETWKSNVQGTNAGAKLMRFLTTLDANLVRNHRDTTSLYKRGYLYGTVGCTRAAIVDLSKAIAIDPLNASLYCERGICYMDMGEYTKAATDLNSAIANNQFSGDAYLARGRLNLILGKPQEALADLLACKESRMEFAPALPDEIPANFYHAPDYYLGVCYDLLGQHEKAINHFDQSSKDVTGGDTGYIHRYADRPQAADKAI